MKGEMGEPEGLKYRQCLSRKNPRLKYVRIIRCHKLKSFTSLYKTLYTFYKSDIYKVIKTGGSLN